MHRFKVVIKDERTFWIEGEELKHLKTVLRLSSGDEVVGFDNSGRQWLGKIESIEKDKAVCKVLKEELPEVEAQTKVFLVVGLAKGEKMEWVIQKGTELGMTGLVPLRTKRAVMRLEGKKAEERVVRWQKIAVEAVKQSRRVIEPHIMKVADWKELDSILPEGTQWLISYEEEKTQSLHQTLDLMDRTRPIALIIGPEGGFTEEETGWAINQLGAKSVSLGARILRAETAALAALTMVLYHYSDLG